MTATQERFPIAPTKFAFGQHGQSGAWVSELLPHTAELADKVCPPAVQQLGPYGDGEQQRYGRGVGGPGQQDGIVTAPRSGSPVIGPLVPGTTT